MNQYEIFADALWKYYETGKSDLRTERDDGLLSREDVSWYFTAWKEFPLHEKKALKFARGRILDVGCGAGRHSLLLQRRGMPVTAIDLSHRIVLLAAMRGVRDARVADISCKLPFANREFDTVVLFGNNLGLAGSIPRFRKMLCELARVTSTHARIVATTRMPTTTDPVNLGYISLNLKKGRSCGQTRLRLRLGSARGNWFDLLLFSPTDLAKIAFEANWVLTQVFPLESLEMGYSVVLEKRKKIISVSA
jgi:SAM-dependent methyltransferase